MEKFYVGAIHAGLCLFLDTGSGGFVEVAKFVQELVVRRPELEPVQPVPRRRLELDRGDFLDTFCHGTTYVI